MKKEAERRGERIRGTMQKCRAKILKERDKRCRKEGDERTKGALKRYNEEMRGEKIKDTMKKCGVKRDNEKGR